MFSNTAGKGACSSLACFFVALGFFNDMLLYNRLSKKVFDLVNCFLVLYFLPFLVFFDLLGARPLSNMACPWIGTCC
jgi:hypothetical protein